MNSIVVKHAAPAQTAADRWPMLTGSLPRILDNLTTAVLTFDAGLRLPSINPAGEMLFEISAKKWIGQKLTGLLPQARLATQTLTRTLETQHPFTARGVRLKLPGSKTITVDCIGASVTDGDPSAAPLAATTQRH